MADIHPFSVDNKYIPNTRVDGVLKSGQNSIKEAQLSSWAHQVNPDQDMVYCNKAEDSWSDVEFESREGRDFFVRHPDVAVYIWDAGAKRKIRVGTALHTVLVKDLSQYQKTGLVIISGNPYISSAVYQEGDEKFVLLARKMKGPLLTKRILSFYEKRRN